MLALVGQPVEAGDLPAAAGAVAATARLAGDIDRAVLPQPHVLGPARLVALQVVQQRAQQRGAQQRLLLGHRVLERHRAPPRVAVSQRQPVGRVRRGEAPAEDLVQARADQRVLRPAAQPLGRLQAPRRPAPRGQRGGQLLEAPDARDLLHQVGLAVDVPAPPVGHDHVEAVGRLGDPEAQPLEHRRLLGPRDRRPEQLLDARLAQAQRRRREAGAADVDRPADRRRAAQVDHQPRRDRLAGERQLGLQTLLEAARRLGAQPEPGRGALQVRAVPGRGLHQHARGPLADLRARAAHDARDRGRPVGVLDHARALRPAGARRRRAS